MAMWKRLTQGMALGLALLATLAGCAAPTLPWQAHGPTPLPDARQVLRVSVAGTVDNSLLDPIHGSIFTFSGALALSLVWSGLLAFDSGLRPVPALADRYSVSADGLRYTFHLRTGARFSDGAPITSADAAFSLDRAAGPCSYVNYYLTALKDQSRYMQEICHSNSSGLPTITAGAPGPLITTLVGDALLTPDPSTLVIILAQPDGALPVKLAEPVADIVERAFVTRYGAAWPSHLGDHGGAGTSGAYVVSSSVSDGNFEQVITLTRARGYWGARPRLRQVIVDTHNAMSTRPGDVVFAGETRGNDPAAEANQQYIQQVMRKQPGFHQTPIRAEDRLLLDPTEPGLTDLRARQALALALNKPAIAALLSGVATNHIIPPGAGAYPTALSGPVASAPLTGDQTQARALWQSYVHDRCGGEASHCPAVTLWGVIEDLVGTDPFYQALDEAIARQWQAALPGLRVRIKPVYFGLMLESLSQVYRLTSDYYWLEDYPDPQDWLQPFASPPNDFSPPIAALVQRAEATHDPTARLALYHQAELALINNATIIPLTQQELAWTVKPTVTNFPANPSPLIPPSVWARIELVSKG